MDKNNIALLPKFWAQNFEIFKIEFSNIDDDFLLRSREKFSKPQIVLGKFSINWKTFNCNAFVANINAPLGFDPPHGIGLILYNIDDDFLLRSREKFSKQLTK